MVTLATWLKMTPAQQSAYTAAAFIAEVGGNASKVAASYATMDRSRRKVAADVASKQRTNWDPPKMATLHWDSKLMPSMSNKNILEERLGVLVGTPVK